jgi:tRNA(Ile2) C34 agmatinyltransferase TiaS
LFVSVSVIGLGVSFAVPEKDVLALTEYVQNFIRQNTYSDNTTLAIFQGLKIPSEVEEYGRQAKRIIFKIDDARRVADRNGVKLVEVTGKRGTIGAVAGIGCFDMGPLAAGLPEDAE